MFLRVYNRSLLKTLGKGEIVHNEPFIEAVKSPPLWSISTFSALINYRHCYRQQIDPVNAFVSLE